MTTKILIYSIAGVFIITGIAYVIISPLATKSLEAPSLMNTNQTEEVVTQKNQSSTTTPKTNVSPVISKISPEQKITDTSPVKETSFSMQDVTLHNSESSCWSSINGFVYDLTSYISRHPGGSRAVIKICGVDGTSVFEDQHGGQSKPEKILVNYKIGTLK